MQMQTVPGSTAEKINTRSSDFELRRALLVRRAAALPEQDRTLVRTVLSRELSFRQLEVLMGKAAGTLQRRAERLIKLLGEPIVVALLEVAGASEGPGAQVNAEDRKIGIEHFLLKRSATTIARERGITYREVVHTIGYLRGWAASVGRRGPNQGNE